MCKSYPTFVSVFLIAKIFRRMGKNEIPRLDVKVLGVVLFLENSTLTTYKNKNKNCVSFNAFYEFNKSA